MTGSERAVGEYLDRLERSLRRLPPRQRRAILEEVGEHLDDTLAELGPDPAEAAVRTALDRLGDPDDIAREARARFGMGSGVPSWTDALAIVLLLLGGFLWVGWWIAGVVLLWMSNVWSTRDKLVGTLVVPGGLLPAVWWAFRTTSCETSRRPDGVSVASCVGNAGGIDVLALLMVALLVLAPIGTAVYLGRRLRRARLSAT